MPGILTQPQREIRIEEDGGWDRGESRADWHKVGERYGQWCRHWHREGKR